MPNTSVKRLRQNRFWHRNIGLVLFAFVLVSAITGILLAFKKDIAIIQPPTQKGVTKDLSEWKSLTELSQLAEEALHIAHPEEVKNKVNRLDVRPSKGIVKAIFKKGYWEVQLDGSTGETLSIERRYSDWIESLHDGSIINDVFKVISMNFLGIGLLLLSFSGFWLWYGPKRIRAQKKEGKGF